MSSTSSSARTDFFKELKPRCVAINDLAVRSSDRRASARQLLVVTEDLSNVLLDQVKRDPSILDEKIADYVSFPLSNILRNHQDFPIRLTELTIKCMGILIQQGWKGKISKELSQQLLIFLTYVIGGVPGSTRAEPVPEETTVEALKALTALITASSSSISGAKSLVEDKNLPALSHTITVVLDTITDGESTNIQVEALKTLGATFAGLKEPESLANFLPGVVSSLSKLLTPPSAWKHPRKVLEGGVAVLRSVLVGILGDVKVTGLLKKVAKVDESAENEGQVFTEAWLKATTEQIKVALSSVLKLRVHKSEDVKAALERFCIALLDECHRSLATCAPILVETAMMLTPDTENRSLISAGLSTDLSDLTSIYPELVDTVKTTVYNWVTSLPRITQSSDEEAKQQAIRNLLKGQRFMNTLRIDSSTLSNSLATSLRDSVASLLASYDSSSSLAEVLPSNEIVLQAGGTEKLGDSRQFRPLLMDHTNQRSTRAELTALISGSGALLYHGRLARDMLDYLRESAGITQIASYWLAFELVKSGLEQSSDLDEFLDFGSMGDSTAQHDELLQELYAFSVSILDSTEEAEGVDWRAQSLALEVAAYTASRLSVDFRPELIDILYPIATYLGSRTPQLREHAVVALNSIAASCGYSNVADLVIDNVDYMLNSISLRLNTFDISPASTQVLQMMIRLTGPKLVPFMDDVVASIFSALENYHGYPLFVESLFNVLAEVVNQGAKSDLLLIDDGSKKAADHQKTAPNIARIEDISQFLESRSERKRKRLEEDDIELTSHPKKPWKAMADGTEQEDDDDDDGDEAGQQVEKKPPPKTPTYMLLARITDLTQHYLTSPSPTLRKSLLDLLAKVCPALSPDEEAFLPIVNAIWPVLLSRLYDPEPFVVVAACDALTALCSSAGDFLSTRIKTEWWDSLGKWCVKAKASAVQRSRPGRSARPSQPTSKSNSLVIPIRSADGLQAKESLQRGDGTLVSETGALGEFTQVAQVWEAVQKFLVGIVRYVRVDDDVFDQVLGLISDSLAHQSEARKAFDAVNADAVWLAMYEAGRVQLEERRPTSQRVAFVEV
ncbi:uncharacterized protein JN550_000063 [Neoarthrinium moseri]|uniref:uncharacterized protein n=1 Tax=Neoarthrinium moseri TaxID=1658444 RepID=UPI001FDE8E39|nr:uncharacterized protein JN550_000063 [Neoarthrinium moseri]KAI1877881.1 hypothetical protein JN550_000063 [Neoarthrinium moseri]